MEIHTRSHTAEKKMFEHVFSFTVSPVHRVGFVCWRRKTCLTLFSLWIIILLSTHQPISFFSQPCLSISQQTSYCALHSLLWRISACEAELISLSQMDVPRNCHSLHQLISRLSAGGRITANRTVQNARRSHVCTHIFAPPTKHLFISLLSLCVFTLAPTHSPCISIFTKITAAHIPIPKCCTQPSRWPLALIYV